MARIAVAGFLHETNTFAPGTTGYADFQARTMAGMMRGAEMLANRKFPMATGGFTAKAQAAGHELFPILWCFAEPGGYVTPVECVGDYATFVSRVRDDHTVENGLSLWVVSDNLRKGAALNAVQIAELLGRRHLQKAA